jgi:transcriptional regulator with XRE-family HTH domain
MKSRTVDRLLKNTPTEVKIYVDLYADIVVRINQLLKEKGITQKKLAEMMEKKPSEISKWLSGEHNFTLKSLAKLSAELGEPLLEVPKRISHPEFIKVSGRSVQSFVIHLKNDSKIKTKIFPLIPIKEPKPLSNAG